MQIDVIACDVIHRLVSTVRPLEEITTLQSRPVTFARGSRERKVRPSIPVSTSFDEKVKVCVEWKVFLTETVQFKVMFTLRGKCTVRPRIVETFRAQFDRVFLELMSTDSKFISVDSPGRTSLLRTLFHGVASMESLRDPTRADLIALLSELTSKTDIERVQRRMMSCKEGRQIVTEHRRVSNVTLEIARSCSLGTFGRAYADFMDQRGFIPSHRPPPKLNPNQSTYVLLRLREVHDFLHVLFACPTTVEGELALKGVEFANCQLPISALAAIIARIQLDEKSQHRLHKELLPWAVRAGSSCSALEAIDFESDFASPLSHVQRKYNIHPLENLLR